MFEKLVEKLTAAGLDAEETYTYAGQYYDGEDHTVYFPVVHVETDLHVSTAPIEKACKLRGLVYDRRFSWGRRSYLFTIWRAEDRERARRMDDVARAFLDAFWMYRHEHGPEDEAGMIAAGRAAVAAMGEV